MNAALDHTRYLIGEKTGRSPACLSLVHGSWCTYEHDSRYRADWALVDPDSIDNLGIPVCLAPGDTKISSKWHNTNLNSAAIAEEPWILPIQQVASYADKTDTRYGFIITDRKLTVMVFRREVISAGIGATRPHRTHARVVSNDSQLSSSVKTMSLGSSDPYTETGSGLAIHVAYRDIPWSAHRLKTITVRLGLFFLCLLAGYDDRNIQTNSYKLETFAPATYDGRDWVETEGEEQGYVDEGDERGRNDEASDD